MPQYWPWIVMTSGIIGIFIYGFMHWLKDSFTLHAPDNFSSEDFFINDDISSISPKEIDNKYKRTRSSLSNEWMPVILSFLVILSALYVILSQNVYPDAQQKWAFGAVGTVLGYWFKK